MGTSDELRDCSTRGCDFSCSMVQPGDRLESWIKFLASRASRKEEIAYMWKAMKRFGDLRSSKLSDVCSPSKALQRYHREQRQGARELGTSFFSRI